MENTIVEPTTTPVETSTAVSVPVSVQKVKKARSKKQQEAFKRCQEKRAENTRIRTELKALREQEKLQKLLAKEKEKISKREKMAKAKRKVRQHREEIVSSDSDDYEEFYESSDDEPSAQDNYSSFFG